MSHAAVSKVALGFYVTLACSLSLFNPSVVVFSFTTKPLRAIVIAEESKSICK